jgi:competence transcription factor ComK
MAVIFSLDAGGTASSVRLDFYDRTGLGRSPGTDRAHQVAHSPPVVARSRTATLGSRRWELETS